MSITVTTNNHFRPVLYWEDLTPRERDELDYYDTPQEQEDFAGFRYRGVVYDLSEFIQSPPQGCSGWDAFESDSFFSGVVIRYVQCALAEDAVVCGTVTA